MNKFFIKIDSVDKVKDFCNKTFKVDFSLDLHSGRYVIDGKSIMGIFSLDLSKKIEVVVHCDDRDKVEKFKETIKEYVVK